MELIGEVYPLNGRFYFFGQDENGFCWGGVPLETAVRAKLEGNFQELKKRKVKMTLDVKIALEVQER